MENFVVSARKYRPVTFESVVGQDTITSTLINAIKNNHLAQAFLFCGPRGVGKTTCARILAKTINCENISDNIEACDKCESCTSFIASHSFNIHELDAASNNHVEDIRNLIDQVRIAPQVGKYSIYIIDEVHMLSLPAFNAFLKTLEEPPPYAIFILATTSKQKIIPTILSRCQIFDFNRIRVSDIAVHLEYVARSEEINAEQDALHVIAQKADGSLRDALSIFDQMVTSGSGMIDYDTVIENLNILDYDYYFKINEAVQANDIPLALLIFDERVNNGFDGHNFITGLAEHFRNLLVCKDSKTILLLQVGASIGKKYEEQARSSSTEFLLDALTITSKADITYNNTINQRLTVELALMQLCSINERKQEEDKEYSINSPDESVQKKTIAEPKSSYDSIAARSSSKPEEDKKIDAKEETAKTDQPALPDGQVGESEKAESELQSSEEEKPVAASTKEKQEQEQISERVTEEDEEEKPIPDDKTKSGSRTVSLSGLSKSAKKEEAKKSKEVENSESTGAGVESKEEVGIDLKTIDIEDLKRVWREYAEEIQKQGKHSLYSTLTKRAPEIRDNNELELTIDNKVQEKEIHEEKQNLSSHLKEHLGLAQITISTIIAQSDEAKKPYTSIEKFKRMAEKNPSISKLKEQLDLDIDF
ncbi:MAG TPA: DNA polymerase III subunit gamma/tau [Flavobacteriales bacterium]|nr:DNA polymerase III subunit gamma/tau [Flavobacteriales bacterium]